MPFNNCNIEFGFPIRQMNSFLSHAPKAIKKHRIAKIK